MTPKTTADVSTTAAFGATIIATTKKGVIGAATTVTISGVNDLATTTSKSTQSSVLWVDAIIRKTKIKP